MNGKRLAAGVFVSCILLTGCQSQEKQSVLAETLASSSIEGTLTKHSIVEVNNEQLSTSMIEDSSSQLEVQEVVGSTSDRSEKELEPAQSPKTNTQTTETFIQMIGPEAQQLAWKEGLYASVMIAQAMLETGSGSSQLSQAPHHNLFGIKGSYQGKQVSFDTQEDQGDGQLYTIQAAFRQYPSYKESLEDYARLLKQGVSGNSTIYQRTWKEAAGTYQEATKALTGTYATDTAYDKKLNELIETYDLTSYDQEPAKEATEPVTSTSEGEGQTSGSTSTVLYPTEEAQLITSETKQKVITLPPVAQRPAKELSGNRLAE